jgi:16S rRNA (cytosine967-C5)-methyltransferase
VAPARAAAAEVLLKLERNGGHSDELLRTPKVDALSAQDRNLATTLVMGTLRWQRVIDERISALLKRPGAEMHISLIVALRLGAYQLLFLDRIPAHAAITESVELAKQGDSPYAAGMVNAVLRKLALEPKGLPDLLHAYPEWMVARWTERFGAATTEKICTAGQEQAPLTLRLLHPEAEASLARAGVVLAPGEFLERARRVVSGDLWSSSALGSGWVRVQDEGSQLVAELAALGAAATVLDTCAAPGGKTAILAERNPAAKITAIDVSAKRLAAMRTLLPPSPTLEYRLADTALLREGAWDAILCDVPCSGTGTLGRNPEIRHALAPEELERQQVRQVAILNAALKALKPGGRLVYSTCSLEREENEAVVEAALRRSDDYELQPLVAEVDQLLAAGVLTDAGAERLRATAVERGFLRTLPGVHGCDGFFAAVFVR